MKNAFRLQPEGKALSVRCLLINHKQYSIPDAEKQGKSRLQAFFVALSEY